MAELKVSYTYRLRPSRAPERKLRTYTCLACEHVKPLERNFAAVMVARAGFNPAGVYRVRLASPTGTKQGESGIHLDLSVGMIHWPQDSSSALAFIL